MSRFKKWLSYLWDLPIERSSSPQNPYLEVVWSQGRKMLNTRNANYSFGNGYKVFQYAFQQIPAPTDHVLVLGFGAGSVAHLLHLAAYEGKISGVEYDAEILRLYAAHFRIPDQPLSLYEEDALAFLRRDREKYDLIVIDLFEDLLTSPLIYTTEFTQLVLDHCAPQGRLIYNTVRKPGTSPNASLVVDLSTRFKHVRLLDFQEINQIILAE